MEPANTRKSHLKICHETDKVRRMVLVLERELEHLQVHVKHLLAMSMGQFRVNNANTKRWNIDQSAETTGQTTPTPQRLNGNVGIATHFPMTKLHIGDGSEISASTSSGYMMIGNPLNANCEHCAECRSL